MLRYCLRTDYAAFFLLLLLVFQLAGNSLLEKKVRRWFVALVVIAVFRIASANLNDWFRSLHEGGIPRIIVSHLVYLLDPTLMCGVLALALRDESWRLRFYLAIPLMVFCAMLVVSLFTGCIASYTPDGNRFIRGPLNFVTWLMLLLYIVLILWAALFRIKHRAEMHWLALATMFICLTMLAELVFTSIDGMQETAVAFSLLTYYLYFQSNTYSSERKKIEEQLDDVRIQAMMAQIHPHFVCNALSCIAEICHEDSLAAEDSIMMLARYLRTHYQTMENERLVPFSQELENIRCYVALEQQVLGDRLSVIIDAPEVAFSVPNLSIETLAENAIRHGINRKQGSGTLEIRTGYEDGNYKIIVRDDGTGFDPDTIAMNGSEHIGLHNAATRLEKQCGAKVSIYSSPGNGCKVEIMIPGDKFI